ncbi:MAG: ABC transporter permease subunit [Firmicutes bacterium]|nr:ABC transporter permease subunit [Bacillota bacterium]
MKAIYKHELKGYSTNITAYVFGVFILLFAGIYTMVYNLGHQVVNFEFVPGSMPYIFLVGVPILTMRVMAEERKQKTDQLLYSLPISMNKIVWGKYLAMLTVFAIPLLIICVYPLILRTYGNVPLTTAYSTMLGFFFLGAALIAIGMFISSLTESQPVAAGLCFIVMLVNYYISSLLSFVSTTARTNMIVVTFLAAAIAYLIYTMTQSSTVSLACAVAMEAVICFTFLRNSASYEGLLTKIGSHISLFDRFENFYQGSFDLTTLVFYISIIAVFLFLCVQSMEKRRWS